MQLTKVLLVLTALAVINTEAKWFRLPLTFPAAFTSLLPFTFNITTDDSDLGSITLYVKPKSFLGSQGRENDEAKVKRDVSSVTADKQARLNSKESRLFSTLTEKWQFGIPSGAGLTLGSVASLAAIIWTVIAKNLEYKNEHGELDWKDSPIKAPIPSYENPHPPIPSYAASPAPSYGPYNAPSYSSDYSIPPHKKPEKGFDGFSKGVNSLKAMQAQAIKGFQRLVGLRDLDSLLHPKPKKWKKKPMQQQYYGQPVYQSPYTYPQQYAPQPSYDPAPSYAPPPVYEQPPPAYAPPPASDPAPAYATPPAELPAYAPPPQDYATAPQPTPVYAPPALAVNVPPPVTAQVDVLPPIYVPPTQYYPANNAPVLMSSHLNKVREIKEKSTQNAQQWNGPSVSPSQSDSLTSASAPVVDSIPTTETPNYISIQTNGFMPIFVPSLPDPMASSDINETPQVPEDTGNVPSFGVAPSTASPLLPSRRSRLDDSKPQDPSLSVTVTVDSSLIIATTVATPITEGKLEMDGTEGPEYSIIADESTTTLNATSVDKSSTPSVQPHMKHRIMTL